MPAKGDAEDIFVYVSLIVGGLIALNYLRNRSAAAVDVAAGFGTQSFPGTQPGGGFSSALEILAPMQVSPAGQAFIKNEEKLSLVRFNDAGHSAIGWGHDIQPGENIPARITPGQAQQLLDGDLANTASVLNGAVRVQLTQNQFDALASLEFDIGAHAFETSTLLRLLNAGNYAGAAQQFSRWIHSQGQVNQGLIGRRARELALFNQ